MLTWALVSLKVLRRAIICRLLASLHVLPNDLLGCPPELESLLRLPILCSRGGFPGDLPRITGVDAGQALLLLDGSFFLGGLNRDCRLLHGDQNQKSIPL